MSRKDWIRALSIALPWGIGNGLVYVIWGPEVQSFFNIGVLAVLGIWVYFRHIRKRKNEKVA